MWYSNSDVNFDASLKKKVQMLQQMMKITDGSSETGTSMQKWDQVWKHEITPWDLGRATPLLASELRRCSARGATNFVPRESKNVSVLVPGCGSGYDLNVIREYLQALPDGASYPDIKTVVGLEISETSLNKAQERIRVMLEGLGDISILKSVAIIEEEHVDIQLKLGDFFEPCNKWNHYCTMNTEGIQDQPNGQIELNHLFDFIYDYTFFCALPPTLRDRWGQRMSALLKPKSGRLLTIMYPVDRLDRTGKELRGPPFPVTVDDYRRVLEPHGFYIAHGPYEDENSVESRKGHEYVCWWGLSNR